MKINTKFVSFQVVKMKEGVGGETFFALDERGQLRHSNNPDTQGWYPMPNPDPEVKFTTMIPSPVEDALRYDAHLSGKNIGYARTSPVEDGVWISYIRVSPEYRGLGVGARLLQEVERNNRGKVIRLRAESHNLMGWYSDRGYDLVDNEYRMKKEVPHEG